jgi:hypothetical protein
VQELLGHSPCEIRLWNDTATFTSCVPIETTSFMLGLPKACRQDYKRTIRGPFLPLGIGSLSNWFTGKVVSTRRTQRSGRNTSRARGANGTSRTGCETISRGKDVSTTMIYTHVLNKPGLGIRSPLDRHRPDHFPDSGTS